MKACLPLRTLLFLQPKWFLSNEPSAEEPPMAVQYYSCYLFLIFAYLVGVHPLSFEEDLYNEKWRCIGMHIITKKNEVNFWKIIYYK